MRKEDRHPNGLDSVLGDVGGERWAVDAELATTLYGMDGVEGDHIAISPPFTITPEEVDISVDAVVATVRELSAELAS